MHFIGYLEIFTTLVAIMTTGENLPSNVFIVNLFYRSKILTKVYDVHPLQNVLCFKTYKIIFNCFKLNLLVQKKSPKTCERRGLGLDA